MDFGALPPETNSARMYAGPGSAPMLAAAASWDKMAAELGVAQAAYQSVIDGLVSEEWMGPASTAMAAAAAPYVAWMGATAAQAEQTAAQAKAAAAAFDSAFAMTVAPPLIVANRSQLAMLVASNFLGQNGAAIAATEAHYAQMWAQDAGAMYGYAAASAAAATVVPFTEPKQTTNPSGQGAQNAAVAQAGGSSAASGAQAVVGQAINATPAALQGLASPLQSSGASVTLPQGLIDGIAGVLGLQPGDVANATSNLLSSSLSPMSLAGMTQIGADVAVIHSVANGGVVGPFGGVIPGWGEGILSPGGIGPELLTPGAGISAITPAAGGFGIADATLADRVTATVGRGTMVGSLSVPQSWAAAAPVASPAGTMTPATGWTVAAHAPEAGAAGMPGVPLAGAGAGRGYGFAAPRYGFKPTVMARPVAAG